MAPGSWEGKGVRLKGLSSAALNGCEGVAGQVDAASGRVCVRLVKPESAALVYPMGVKIKPENLERISEAKAAPAATSPKGHSGAPANKGGAAQDAAPPADGDWWVGMTHKAAYLWFIDAYMLRVEDEYTHGGALFGAYADATGQSAPGGSCVARDFCAFMEAAERAAALPSWFDGEDCAAHASGRVGLAIEASDLREKHGPFGVMALRVLATRITGGPPGTDAGMGAPQEEWDEDEEEWDEDEWNADEEGGFGEEDDPLWDKGEDEEDAEEEPESREQRLLQRWAGQGEQSAEEAAAFAAACAAAHRTPPTVLVLTGLSYIYSDDETQSNTFERACRASKVQCTVQPMAPPGSPPLLDECRQRILAALPRAACLVVLQAEAAGAGRVLPLLRGALRAWVAAGGSLAVNGAADACTRDVVPMLRALFPEATAGWAMDDAGKPDASRADAVPCEDCDVLLLAAAPELPPRVSANVHLLSGVPTAQRLYAAPAQSYDRVAGLCALAVGAFGKGRVIYFGDVAGKEPVARAVVELATHRLKPW